MRRIRVLAVIFFCLIVLSVQAGPPRAPLQSRTCILQKKSFFSYDKRTMERALTFLLQQDKEAFSKLVFSGQVIFTEKDIQVYIEQTPGLLLSQVRPVGKTEPIWVLRNSLLKCP